VSSTLRHETQRSSSYRANSLTHRALDGERQLDAPGPEDIVNRGHRVERAWESDEGRQLVDGLTDLDQLDTDIERRAVYDFSRRRHRTGGPREAKYVGLPAVQAISNSERWIGHPKGSIPSLLHY
jgi:hypothetical protein